MTVRELNREQLIELKENYVTNLVNEGLFREVFDVNYDEPCYGFMSEIDNIVSDETVFRYYDGVTFTDDDFFSC